MILLAMRSRTDALPRPLLCADSDNFLLPRPMFGSAEEFGGDVANAEAAADDLLRGFATLEDVGGEDASIPDTPGGDRASEIDGSRMRPLPLLLDPVGAAVASSGSSTTSAPVKLEAVFSTAIGAICDVCTKRALSWPTRMRPSSVSVRRGIMS